MRTKRVTGVLLVLALCLSLAGVTVLAAEEAEVSAAEPVDFTRSISLGVAEYAEGHEFAEDFPLADVVVDVYLVAEAAVQSGADAYGFILTDDFADVVDLDDMAAIEAQSAQAVAAMRAATAEGSGIEPVFTIAYGGSVSSPELTQGLYLLVPHGADITDYVDGDTTIAQSPVYEYHFEPQLVSIPTRVPDDGSSVVRTSDSGAWVYDIAVTLKAERSERFGSLRIEKTVNGFDGLPVTFVFSITEVDESGAAVPGGYSNVAAIYYDGTAQSAYTVVTMIPAGINVVVEEIYSGARYDNVTARLRQTVAIVADGAVSEDTPMAVVSYVNDRNDNGNHGYGIENNFTFVQGEWRPATTPEQNVNGE